MTDTKRTEVLVALASNLTVTRRDENMASGTRSGLACSNKSEDGGRYWIRTSDLCDVNAAL